MLKVSPQKVCSRFELTLTLDLDFAYAVFGLCDTQDLGLPGNGQLSREELENCDHLNTIMVQNGIDTDFLTWFLDTFFTSRSGLNILSAATCFSNEKRPSHKVNLLAMELLSGSFPSQTMEC